MKKLMKLLSLLAVIAGIAWALRDQMLPGPTAPTSHPPAFRHPPPPAPSPNGPAALAAGDDLTAVNGIGPVYAKRLADAGVTTFRQLAGSDADELAARTELSRERLADWIGKAGELA